MLEACRAPDQAPDRERALLDLVAGAVPEHAKLAPRALDASARVVLARPARRGWAREQKEASEVRARRWRVVGACCGVGGVSARAASIVIAGAAAEVPRGGAAARAALEARRAGVGAVPPAVFGRVGARGDRAKRRTGRR